MAMNRARTNVRLPPEVNRVRKRRKKEREREKYNRRERERRNTIGERERGEIR